MALDKPGSRFVLTDEMKYSPTVQISRRTGLVSDYGNQYFGFSFALYNYAETKQFSPEKLPQLEARMLASMIGFQTYRSGYLRQMSQKLNAQFFNGEMTPQDEEDMANDIFAGSSRSEALDALSIAFKAELDTIRTAADIPRFAAMFAQYEPRFRGLFRD